MSTFLHYLIRHNFQNLHLHFGCYLVSVLGRARAFAPLIVSSNCEMPAGDAPCATMRHGLGGTWIVPGRGASNHACGALDNPLFSAEVGAHAEISARTNRKMIHFFLAFIIFSCPMGRNSKYPIGNCPARRGMSRTHHHTDAGRRLARG